MRGVQNPLTPSTFRAWKRDSMDDHNPLVEPASKSQRSINRSVCICIYIYIYIGSCLDDFPIQKKGGIPRDESACSTIFHSESVYSPRQASSDSPILEC